jgi:hypothetical protein
MAPQKILFGNHADHSSASIHHRGSRDALFGQQRRGCNQILLGIDHMNRCRHDIGGFQGLHHPVLGQGIRHAIDLFEIGGCDIDISLHGLHGFNDIGIGNIDGCAFSKVA